MIHRRTQSTPYPKIRVLVRALALSVLTLLIATGLTVSPDSPGETPANAATTASCDYSGGTAQNELKVTPSHGKVFYIDSQQGQNVDAAYVGYRVENQSASSSKANLWATVDSFTGGVVQLANPSDRHYQLDTLGVYSAAATTDTDTAFFLLKAGTSSTSAQSHVFKLFDRDPRLTGAQEVYSCTFTFSRVMETIKARANKVSEVNQTTTTANRIGGQLIVTVEGQTGTIGSGTSSPDGKILWFTPAARSDWPSGSLRLQSTSIQLRSSVNSGSIGVFVNQLRFPASDHGGYTKLYYTATYTFRITGPLPASVEAIPIAQISSGTQIKHTAVESVTSARGENTITLAPTLAVTVTKSASTTVTTVDGKRQFDYSVTLGNSGSAVSLDSIVDQPQGGLSFVTGSAKYNGASISDPAVNSSGHLVFSHPNGQFPVSATNSGNPDRLTYKMETTDCAGGSTFDYTNRVYASLGSVTVGESGTRVSGIQISGSCPVPSSITPTDADQTLSPAATTLAASNISTNSSTSKSTATLNGTVDPNGVSGQAITFTWGTSPTLSGPTTTSAGTSTNSEDFYAVSASLTDLIPGTTYYYRVSIGSVSGEIVSFTTAEVVANPTVQTNPVTNITTGGAVTFNGTIDPNQVTNGTRASFVFGETGGSGTDATCTGVTYGSDIWVKEFDDNDQPTSTDLRLSGSFPVPVSWDRTGLTANKYYCVKARTTWDTGSAEGSPVLFRVASIAPQTITFPTPASDKYDDVEQLRAQSDSGLAVSYLSNTPDVCIVVDTNSDGVGDSVKIIGAGVCSLTASQDGDTSFYPAEPVTVTFTISSYTVTYNVNGGDSQAPIDSQSPYVKGQTVSVSSATPTRMNYTFLGWNTQANGGGTDYARSSTIASISSNVTLFAQWTQGQVYTVSYDANGGSDAPATTSHGAGDQVTIPSTEPVRSGYRFTGWSANNQGYSPGSTLTIGNGNVTLVAQWVQRFTLTYNSNTATSGSPPTGTTHDSGENVTVASNSGSLQKTGYTFAGWNSLADGTGTTYAPGTGQITGIASNTTVYAQWTINSYTIRYDSNGSSDAAPGNQTANHGTSPTVSAAPGTFTKTGFNFDGWNTAADGSGTDYTPGSSQIPSISSDVTLFAKWYAQVTYTSGGATSGSVPTDSTKYRAGQSTTVLGNTGSLEKTGFRFGGWQTGAGPTNVDPAQSVPINSNTTFTARWIPVYSVTFDGNGESGGTPPTSRIIDAGDSTNLPGNAGNLVKTNQVFGGWNTQQDGLGTTIAPGGSFTPTADTVLWAIWLPEVTITYDGNGNTSGSSPGVARYGSGQTATVSGNSGGLNRTGFSFSGWQTTPTGGTVYQAGTGSFTITANITLYARWVEVTSGNNGGGQNPPATRNPRNTPVITPTFQPPVTTPATPPRLVPGPVTPPAVTTPPTTPPGQTTPPAATPPSPQNTNPVSPPQGGVLGGGSLLQRGVGTVDLGEGPQPVQTPGSTAPAQANSANGPGPQVNTAVRNRQTLLAEELGGFQPGTTTTVEILGARTGARFVVTETSAIDTVTLVRAMRTSIEAQRSDFFAINEVAPATEPIPAPEWNEQQRSTANDLFTRSGLPAPRTLAEFDTSQFTSWVFVSTEASTYAPGTTVYLTLTSQPVVLAEAVVDEDGEVSISGTLPAEILEAGEHRVRLVGIRALDGVSVADDGSIVVSDELMNEIERFDLGTQSTIAVVGTNPTGDTHAAIRIIPLVPVAPWWLLWFIALGLIIVVIATWRGWFHRGRGRLIASLIVLASAIPAVIGGWLSTVTTVTWWGVGLGLLGAAMSALQPRKRSLEPSPQAHERSSV